MSFAEPADMFPNDKLHLMPDGIGRNIWDMNLGLLELLYVNSVTNGVA